MSKDEQSKRAEGADAQEQEQAQAPAQEPDAGEKLAEQAKRRARQIHTLQAYCTRVRGADCARCQMGCPAEAISFNEDGCPEVDADACTLCGICMGICDAFTTNRVDMEDVHEHILNIAKRGDDIVITCEENVFPGLNPASNVVVLPCLACLSPEFWTLLLAENMTVRIAADLRYCNDCERAGNFADALYSRAIETAESYVDGKIGYQRVIPEKPLVAEEGPDGAGADRRDAFTNLADDAVGIAFGKRRLRNSKTLNDYVARRDKTRAQARLRLSNGLDFKNTGRTPKGKAKKTLWPKRKLLLCAIDSDPDIAKRIPIMLSATDTQKCAGCRGCVEACPSGARQPSAKGEPPAFDARYCIACGLCVDACPEGAVSLEETTAAALQREEQQEEQTE